jgi:hypothetical protein
VQGSGIDSAIYGRLPVYIGSFSDLYLLTFTTASYVVTTNDGSKYWTIVLQKTIAAGTQTAIVNRVTSGDTANNMVRAETAINALLGVVATYKQLQFYVIKTSTPGAIYVSGAVTYRYVAT